MYVLIHLRRKFNYNNNNTNEDSQVLKIAWMHQYKDSKTTLKRAKKDILQQLGTAQPT